MRKIVAGLFMSLDGVVEAPEKWQMPYFDEDMATEIGAQMAQSDTLLLGRRTYEEFAAFWPSQGDAGPGAFMNNVTKLVVSRTLRRLDWRSSTRLQGDLGAQLVGLKQQPGKNILISGSPTLVQSLVRGGLLDELGVMVCPVLVGSGGRLFDDGAHAVPVQLVDSRSSAPASST